MGEPEHVVYLLRHGETAWSASGRHTGRTDIELTETGDRQARLAGDLLRAMYVDDADPLVLCSPRIRATRTAELAGFPPTEVTKLLSEWDYGDYEGMTTEQIRELDRNWTIWSHPVPGGETAETVGARAELLLQRVRESLTSTDVVLVGHGHFSRVLISRWLLLPPEAGVRFALEPASVTMLGHERGEPQLRHLNLPPAGGELG